MSFDPRQAKILGNGQQPEQPPPIPVTEETVLTGALFVDHPANPDITLLSCLCLGRRYLIPMNPAIRLAIADALLALGVVPVPTTRQTPSPIVCGQGRYVFSLKTAEELDAPDNLCIRVGTKQARSLRSEQDMRKRWDRLVHLASKHLVFTDRGLAALQAVADRNLPSA